MKSETNVENESRLVKRRARWGKMVKGNQAESGGGGCGDCMLKGSGGGVWGFLREAGGSLSRTVEGAVLVWEYLLLLPFFKFIDNEQLQEMSREYLPFAGRSGNIFGFLSPALESYQIVQSFLYPVFHIFHTSSPTFPSHQPVKRQLKQTCALSTKSPRPKPLNPTSPPSTLQPLPAYPSIHPGLPLVLNPASSSKPSHPPTPSPIPPS